MQRRAYLGALAAFTCLHASFAAEILFPSLPGLGARAFLEVTRPSYRSKKAFSPLRVQLSVGGVNLGPGEEGFESVKVEGLTPIGKPGAPDLPATGVLIAVPQGMEPQLTVLSHNERLVESALVQPCQKMARCRLPKEQVGFHFDAQLYQSNQVYPLQSARLEEVGSLQGLRLVRLALYPLQMQMQAGALLVSTEITAEVRFHGKAKPQSLSPSIARIAQNIAANGEDLRTVLNPLWNAETLLIVVADSLEETLQPLITWKRQRGLKVDVVKASEAGSDRLAIKNYIQTYYNAARRKPSFLLMVGNKTTLPGFMEETSMGSAATDYPYALLDGDDAIPDLLYGRLLADSVEEAKTQVERWVAYEKTPSGTWFPNATTIASNEGMSPSDEDYAHQVEQSLNRFSYRKVDNFFEGNDTATHTNIWEAMKEGRSWLAYFGHGTGTDWASTNSYFANEDIDKVDNAGKLPFIVDVACENASWVNLPRCFGKAWISLQDKGTPKGAVAYLGGSVNVSWHEPATMSVGIAKYHFERPVQTIGASVFAGQMYLLEKMGLQENTIDNLKWYNLFGDPSLTARTDNPKPYSVTPKAVSSAGTTEVEIVATDAFAAGIPSVQATLWAPGQTTALATGATDTSGHVTLYLKSDSVPAGTLLTTTGYNLETYQNALVP